MKKVLFGMFGMFVVLAIAACAPTPALVGEQLVNAQHAALQATAAPTATVAPTKAAAPAMSDSAFLTMNLQAGFPLDPFLVSVNGGGTVDASTLSPDCVGYVNENPTLAAHYTGKAELLRAFYFSNHDAVLVIKTPDGKYLCSDDTQGLELDPTIDLKAPAGGDYSLWVGSYDKGQLIPGVLVLTAQKELDPLTFSLAKLIPQETDERQPILGFLLKALKQRAQNAPTLATDKPIVVEKVTSDGKLPAYELPSGGALCNGYISAAPSEIFNVTADTKHLRVFFEGDADSTLVVLTPDRRVLCNDDFVGGKNSNPLLDVENPSAGTYAVFVGRVNPDKPLSGKLTVTTSDTATPASTTK